jgi:hypothetical protein
MSDTEKTVDRFDFEQQIMKCWSVVDDLKSFAERSDVSASDYQALAQVYEIKFNVLFDQFESMVRTRQIT